MIGASNFDLLLDTSVFSLFLKPNDSRTALYLPDLQDKLLCISFATVAEIYRWAIQRSWQLGRWQDLQETLKRVVILPYHDSVSLQWARIQTSTPKSHNDAWVAACALAYGCTLVTDDDDFDDIQNLRVIRHPHP